MNTRSMHVQRCVALGASIVVMCAAATAAACPTPGHVSLNAVFLQGSLGSFVGCAPITMGNELVTFSASGMSTVPMDNSNPYPGSFQEEGSYIIDTTGAVTKFKSLFEIDVCDGTVIRGVASGPQADTASDTKGTCSPRFVQVDATYLAMITFPDGTVCLDSGTVNLKNDDGRTFPFQMTNFTSGQSGALFKCYDPGTVSLWPLPLDGETIQTEGQSATFTGTCVENRANQPFTFSAPAGVASGGPYLGTFSASGSFTTDTTTHTASTFDASFEIDANDGTIITGTNTGFADTHQEADCSPASDADTGFFDATIRLPDGRTCTDVGLSRHIFDFNAFQEDRFTSYIFVCDAVVPLSQVRAARAALASLGSLGKDADGKLRDAISHLDKSLAGGLWVDDFHLASPNGQRVFDELGGAIHKLGEIKHPPAAIAEAVTALVAADRAIDDETYNELATLVSSSTVPKLHQEYAKAQTVLARATQSQSAGRVDQAIEGYEQAWHHAEEVRRLIKSFTRP